MSGPFNARRARRRPAVNITSLIDVMFLLLIFFMVSSTFRERIGIDITLPAAQSAAAQDIEPHEIVVDAEGGFYFGEQKVDRAGLEAGLRDLLAEDPEALLVIRGDDAAGWGKGIEAIDIARSAGGKKLVILTKPQVGEGAQSSS